MPTKSQHSDTTRRQFGVGIGACTVAVVVGSMASARGGGGDVQTQQAEKAREHRDRDRVQNPLGFTQTQFVNMSRSKLFELNMQRNAYVDGFSEEMSAHLFDMGVANLPGTKALLKRLRNVRRTPRRQDVLDQEVATARQNLDGFFGFAVQRKKREIYHEKVALWAQNPREGGLDLRYSG